MRRITKKLMEELNIRFDRTWAIDYDSNDRIVTFYVLSPHIEYIKEPEKIEELEKLEVCRAIQILTTMLQERDEKIDNLESLIWDNL